MLDRGSETAVAGSQIVIQADNYSVTTPAPERIWRDLLTKADDPLVTQTPEWMSGILAGTHWKNRSRLYKLDNGKHLLVPLVGFGVGPMTVLTSFPTGWGYGGALSSDGSLTVSDVLLITKDLATVNALRTSFTPSPFDRTWATVASSANTTVEYLTQVLDLSMGRDRVWKGYKNDVRRNILHAQRNQVRVQQEEGAHGLPVFYDLYKKSIVRWARAAGRPPILGLIQQRIIERIHVLTSLAAELGPAFATWTAFVRGRPAAAMIILRGGAHTLNWRAAMDRDLAGPSHANALLQHYTIEKALEEGAKAYSFGESDVGSSLAAYKARYGARPVTWSTYHWERLPVTTASLAVREAYRRAAPWLGRIPVSRDKR
jgi:hypothetical protein